MKRLLLAGALAACGGAARAPVPAPSPAKAATLADLGWLAGTWHAAMLDAHWENVAGALYGIALSDHGFEVNIIDDTGEDGTPMPITLLAFEDGASLATFPLDEATPQRISFGKRVTFEKTAGGIRGEFVEDPARHPIVFTMQPGALPAAAEIEQADRAFAADTAKDGAAGWARWFAPDGAMWRPAGRIERPQIEATIAKTLAHGQLAWEPASSGVRGDTGFTLGTWTFTAGADHAHGSYVTIWKRQPEGSWRVAFDVGRPAG